MWVNSWVIAWLLKLTMVMMMMMMTMMLLTTGAALPENNEASAELNTANVVTFTSCSARLGSQSHYRSLDQ